MIDWAVAAKTFGIVIGSLFTLWATFKKTYNREGLRWKKTFKGNAEIKRMLEKFVHEDAGSCRAALLYLENGGGVPYAGAQIYSSVVHEANDIGDDDYTPNWQRVRVDSYYNYLLSQVAVNGVLRIDDVNSMKDGTVKDSALSVGITAFDIYFVKATRKKWFYLVVSRCKSIKQSKETAQHRDSVRILVDKLYKKIG